MSDLKLQTLIEQAYEDRATINARTSGDVRDAVDRALGLLDGGKARVAEKIPGARGRIPGRSTSGSRRRRCCRSASMTTR